MGAPRAKASVEVTTNTNLVNNAETVIAGPIGIPVLLGDRTVTVKGHMVLTSDAACTGLTLRIRRGLTAAGTLVGEANAIGLSVAAGGTEEHNTEADDAPGVTGSASYVLTAERAGAAGTAVAAYAHLTVEHG